MKKLVLIGLMLSLSTGCGRSWLPCLSRGARCQSGSCIGAAPALPSGGCSSCADGTVAGYGSYGGEVASGEYFGGETIVGDSYSGSVGSGSVINGTISSPPMQSLPPRIQ